MITVITPTIAGRGHLLAEAIDSVTTQRVGNVAVRHLIEVDRYLGGPAVVRNRLAAGAEGWLAFLDDDDMWDPDHLATVHRHVDQADVIYTLARIEGRPDWDPQQDEFDPERLRRANYIPLCGALVRAELFHQVGGFPTDLRYEDHGLWLGLLDAGARFLCIPRRTWTYRFGAWDSRSRQVWDGRR